MVEVDLSCYKSLRLLHFWIKLDGNGLTGFLCSQLHVTDMFTSVAGSEFSHIPRTCDKTSPVSTFGERVNTNVYMDAPTLQKSETGRKEVASTTQGLE